MSALPKLSDLPEHLPSLLKHLNEAEQRELSYLLTAGILWMPQAGQQTKGHDSQADILGYGGAAGGGKTDLAIGLALTQHQRAIIYRKEGTQLQGIYDRAEEIIGHREGFNSQDKKWRHNGRIMEFGGLANPTDHKKFQGRAHDLKCFDEVTEIPEYMVRFLMGWLRSSDPDQRKRIVMTFNPPTSAEGRWVVAFFAPWLDPDHPNPALPGELRWFTTIDGEDMELPSGDPIEVDGEMVQPLSRTFIPARVEDNIYYMESGYKAVLQAMPEPLRSQMLRGDFTAGLEDDPWQVIPTSWVEEAQARWEPLTERVPMDSMGVDVARGGSDETVIAPRHGNWFAELEKYPGQATPDGPTVAGLVIARRRDAAPIHIDVIGWGASAYDSLVENGCQVIPCNAAETAKTAAGIVELSKDGTLRFFNRRSMWWWRMREALDPANGELIALPPDRELLIQLTCAKWSFGKQGVQVESKDEIKKRIQRSTDDADAVIMANIDTPLADLVPERINFTGWGG